MAKKKHKKKSQPHLKDNSNKTASSNLNSNQSRWLVFVSTFFCPLLIIIVTAFMVWWSWGTWCDPMIDFGRELYVPWQITQGGTLYTDIAYFNGPLSPYVNAIAFSLLGVNLRSILFINFLILILILFFSYQLLKKIGSRVGATVGCLVIVTVFSFAKYHFIASYNFIAPYSHEMLHGLMLSLMGIWSLSLYQDKKKNILLFLSGVSLGLIFLTKIEFTIASAVAYGSGLLFIFWSQNERKTQMAKKGALFMAGGILPPLVAFLLLSCRMSFAHSIIGTLGSWVGFLNPELREMFFYRHLMGVDTPWTNLKIMTIGFGALILLFLPVIIFSYTYRISKRQSWIAGLLLIAGMAFSCTYFINAIIPISAFMLRPLPLLLLSGIIVEIIRLRFQYRQRAIHSATVLRLIMLIYSLLLLLKIIFRTDPSQYGFALAMPGTLMMVSAFVDELPSFLEQKGASGVMIRLYAIGMIMVFTGIHLLWSGFWYFKTNVEVKSDTATFYADSRGTIVQKITDEIKNNTSPQDTLAVFPEGVMLNFLTQRKNPTPYINFMPPEFFLFGETKMLRAYRKNPPDYIVLANKSLHEYGFQEMGIDIGVELYQWIEKHYTPVTYIKQDADGDLPFTRMRLLRRVKAEGSNHSSQKGE